MTLLHFHELNQEKKFFGGGDWKRSQLGFFWQIKILAWFLLIIFILLWGADLYFYSYFRKIFEVLYEVVRRSNRRGMEKW
jgi:hypothetical protein